MGGETEQNTDETEATYVEKAYCCSNYPQTETTLIAKFDLVLEAIGLVSFIISIATAASKDESNEVSQPEKLNATNISQQPLMTPYENITNDLSMFFQWPVKNQLVVMSLSLFGCATGMIFSVILWIGVIKKNHAFLLTWFIFNLICQIGFTVLGIVVIVKATTKVLVSLTTVSFFLYKWYCLWIVKLLMSEIRAIREGYTNPLDDADGDQANHLVLHSDSFTVDKF